VIATAPLLEAALVAWGYIFAPGAVPGPAPATPADAAPAPAVPVDVAAPADAAAPANAAVSAASPSPVGAPLPAPLPAAPLPTPVPGELPAPPGRKGKSKKRDGHGGDGESRFGSIEVKGRIFVLGELQRRDVAVVGASGMVATDERESLDISVASVRPALRWQAPQKWLSAVIEVELTREPDLRDGYVQAKGNQLAVRAGQFKMPGSAIETTSPWVLPLVRRGFLHTLLVDGLDTPWRRPGVMLRWRAAELLRPELSAAIYQGVMTTTEGLERKKELIFGQSLSAQGLIARAQIEPADGVQVGAWYDHRVGTPGILRNDRYWTAGADVVVDRLAGRGGLRLWLDGTAGASWFEHPSKTADGQDTTFASGRAIVAWRFGGVEPEAGYLEPYATFGVLDPDIDVTADLAVEAAVGANVGLWQRLRLSAQGEIYRTGRNFPPGYFLGIDPDHVALLVQLGVAL
jgi:hypothetical protein